MTEPLPGVRRRVLVVDDEAPIRDMCARILERAGFDVCSVSDGVRAVEALDPGAFHAVVSDIAMPGLSGIELLRAVRALDFDLPVVLVTGSPSVETAAEAVAYGAVRYLVKPLGAEELEQAVRAAIRLGEVARLRRDAAALVGVGEPQVGDRAGLEVAFDRALGSLYLEYQPIVHPASRRVMGVEALLRSREPALASPGGLLVAAERLGRVHAVSRKSRRQVAGGFAQWPADVDVFVNLHPADLLDDELYDAGSPLAASAGRIVLEVTERIPLTEGVGLPDRVSRLKSMGYRIALDDLGAGYAGLSCFALLGPDIVKVDMGLVRNIEQQPVKQKLLASVVQLCADLAVTVVAEGIETAAERDMVASLGCHVMQGYLFARPGPAFPEVRW